MAVIRAPDKDKERETRKEAKENKKQEREQKKAEAVAALEKEKTEKLPGIQEELVTLREVRNYKKVVMNRLKEILIFYGISAQHFFFCDCCMTRFTQRNSFAMASAMIHTGCTPPPVFLPAWFQWSKSKKKSKTD